MSTTIKKESQRHSLKMPVDNSGKEKRSRSNGPFVPEERQRDQERKRLRGALACAECNRLKVKCDKQIPCSNCVRRGCSSICPNSALSGGRGTRYVLAETEDLHRKLLEMSERIRQLEDALAIETAGSPNCHPLLSPSLMSIKLGLEPNTEPEEFKKEREDCLEDFSSLTISEQGVTHFIGRTGGSERALLTGCNNTDDEPAVLDSTTPGGDNSAEAAADLRTHQILARLPPFERAWGLCETYLQQASWSVRLVRRTQLIDELLIPIYKAKDAAQALADATADVNEQDLALLLIVFAIGALMDMTLPPYNGKAEDFFVLAHSIINLETASDKPTLATVQILGLMVHYYTLADYAVAEEQKYTDKCFVLLSYAATLGVTDFVGLIYHEIYVIIEHWIDRDPAKWKLENKMIQRRRDVYWQIFAMQAWGCFASGRPMMANLDYTDSEFPDDDETVTCSDGTTEIGYWRWLYIFAKDITYRVGSLNCTVGPLKYSDILELDRKVRELAIPPHLRIPAAGSDWDADGPYVVMQRLLPVLWRETTMLFIHRSCFAKALSEHPTNPLKSQFASSFLCAYRCSLSLIQLARDHYELCPDFMVRSWMLWKNVFSALVIMGTIVVRGPNSTLAPSALFELTLGINFFEKVVKHARWARRAMSALYNLRERAFSTYAEYRSGLPADSSETGNSWFEQLAIFAGQNHLVPSTKTPQSQGTWQTAPSGLPAETPTPSATDQIAAHRQAYMHQPAASSFYSGGACPVSLPSIYMDDDEFVSHLMASSISSTAPDHSLSSLWNASSVAEHAPPDGQPPAQSDPFYFDHQMNNEPPDLSGTRDLGFASVRSNMGEAWSSFLQESEIFRNTGDQ